MSIVNTITWIYLALIVVGLFFIPSSVFAYYVVMLNPPQSSVEEGTSVNFTGTVAISCDDCIFPDSDPASGVIVHIMDLVTNSELVSDVSDNDGKFSAQWNAKYRPNNYLIFAVAYTDHNIPQQSQNYSLSVYQQSIENNIQLILEPPIPSTQVTLGQTVTFNGHLVADDKLDKQLKYANKKKIPFVVIIGPDEAKNNKVTVKNMTLMEQTSVPQDELAQYLKKQA